NAVLYEGYLLYPYRASAVKNQQRFNFGVLYPAKFCEGSDASSLQVECLVEGPPSAELHIKTRFLQLVDRNQRQEGIERDVEIRASLAALACAPLRRWFSFDPIAGSMELQTSRRDENLFRITARVSNVSTFAGTERAEALLHSMVS